MILIQNKNTLPMILKPYYRRILRIRWYNTCSYYKTSHGLIKRALTKICILPIEDNM